jgi:hypothetical protein
MRRLIVTTSRTERFRSSGDLGPGVLAFRTGRASTARQRRGLAAPISMFVRFRDDRGHGIKWLRLAVMPLLSLVLMALAVGMTTSQAYASTGGKVKSASLNITSDSENATAVTYTVTFISPHAMTSGSSTVTMAAPAGTTFTTPACDCGYDVFDNSTDTDVPDSETAVLSNGNSTATFKTPNVNAGDVVTAVAYGVQNSSASGGNLDFSTSSNTRAVKLPLTLVSESSVESPMLTLSSTTPGATGVMYSVGFTATNSLTGGVASQSTVTLSAPAGTVFPNANDDYYVCNDTSDPNSSGTGCTPTEGATLSNGNSTATFFTTLAHGGDHLTAYATDVTNPTVGTSLSFSTSSDPSSVTLPFTGTSSSPYLDLSSYYEGASDVQAVDCFTNASTLIANTSTITVTFPTGTSIINPVDGVEDVVTDTSAHTDTTGLFGVVSSNSIMMTVGGTSIPAGDYVCVDIGGITNSTTTGSLNVDLSASTGQNVNQTTSQPFTTQQSVSAPSVQLSNSAEGTTNVDYAVTFTIGTGLIPPEGDITGSVTLSAPVGTVFTSSSCDVSTDDTRQRSVSCVTGTNGATTTIPAPFTYPGDTVTVFVPGVTNTTTKGRQTLTVSTSSDPNATPASASFKIKR